MDKYDDLYMEAAGVFAKRSVAVRKKVGAVIVKNNSIVSHGWNGMPSGMDNTCEVYDKTMQQLVSLPEVMHAEEIAILKATKTGISLDGAEMFVTLSPCIQCAKMSHAAGIKRIVYSEAYKGDDGIKFLKKVGVEYEKFEAVL
jgi:dCMP deaminase